jgi:hypothetical protein
MAITSYQPPFWCSTGRSAWNTLDATTDGAAVIFQMPVAGNIDAIAFGTATTATPVPMTVRVEGATVAGGLPDGSLIHANATGTAAGNTSANTVEVVTFTAPVAVTRGQLIAALVQPSTTPASVQIASVGPANGPWPGGGLPYAASNTAGTWSKTVAAGFPMIAVRYESGDYVWAGIPVPLVTAFTSRSISTGTGASTGTRRGIRFKMDRAFTLDGVWAYGFWGGSGDGSLVLYSDAGAEIATLTTFDASQLLGTGNIAATFTATTAQSLTADTWYRVAFVPSTANAIGLYEAATTSAALLQTLAGPDIEVQQAAYVNSAWSDTATSTTLMGVFGSDATTAGGGGGTTTVGDATTDFSNFLTNVIMSGRFRQGTGSPEGVITAGVGSIYLRADGGANTSIYVKESGTGNTGWVAK